MSDYAVWWRERCIVADAKFVAAMHKHHQDLEVPDWEPPTVEEPKIEPKPIPEPESVIPLAVWHWSCTALRPFDNFRHEIKPHHPQMTTIQRLVSARYNVSKDELRSRSRKSEFFHPRAVAMFLCRELIPRDRCSFPTIGRAFGHRDHTTVMHAIRDIEKRMKNDQCFHKEIIDLRDEIEAAI